MQPMTKPSVRLQDGAVGVIETRYLNLPEPLALDCGKELSPVRIAYETYGTLSPSKNTSSSSATP